MYKNEEATHDSVKLNLVTYDLLKQQERSAATCIRDWKLLNE